MLSAIQRQAIAELDALELGVEPTHPKYKAVIANARSRSRGLDKLFAGTKAVSARSKRLTKAAHLNKVASQTIPKAVRATSKFVGRAYHRYDKAVGATFKAGLNRLPFPAKVAVSLGTRIIPQAYLTYKAYQGVKQLIKGSAPLQKAIKHKNPMMLVHG